MKRLIYFETYMQECCTDEEFCDNHIQIFCMKRKEAKKIIKGIWGKSLRWFLRNCDYDMTDELYDTGLMLGKIEHDYIVRSAI